jgi:uncharacterized protein (TIGR03086 family)
MSDLVTCHREVMEISIAAVEHLAVGDLARPTPCDGWSLHQLLAHMIGQNIGFAAAAASPDAGQDRAVFADRPVGDHPAVEYADSARRVIDAFSDPDLLSRTMYLPEVRGGMTFPARVAIGFHLVDYVVHSWDVARSLGTTVSFGDDVLSAALAVAEAVPEEAKGIDVATAFGLAVRIHGGSVLDRIVATLGRSPDWRAPRADGKFSAPPTPCAAVGLTN